MTGHCGATNSTLGLRCDRQPHPPGTAHYQDEGNVIRAWPDTSEAQDAHRRRIGEDTDL